MANFSQASPEAIGWGSFFAASHCIFLKGQIYFKRLSVIVMQGNDSRTHIYPKELHRGQSLVD